MTETNPILDKAPDTDSDAGPDGAFLRTRGVSKSFHGRPVLKEADFRIGSGEIAVLIGKSGSGKSTLLRVIAGLEEPDAGDIDLAGETVVHDGEYQDAWKDLRGQIGMIFQSYTLWPHMNVLDNLTIAPRLTLGESKGELLERAEQALTEVGMARHLRSRCTQLSGGERQRVAIARALMMRPRLLLCDEITSALDPPVAAEVLGVLTKLKEEEGIACGIVTHDMAFASKAADRICFFEDGLIKEDVPPEQAFNDPQTPGLRAFIDAVRF
ncbi:amino acid ABC transporter ATP-binding protein [Streptomyces lanatus]|uniref:Amino acid ABC transporter ATP-binding protein n=1 Tax=Streptomyces lanatus TaxID=66900 RepID=A0ABV1XQC7_9ACTN|nr:amino acid ABC transporter ATP-binding protein [Streptomyces lanatus]GHG88386.1 putative amino-acid ABC transporter ATP-binding protein y4tH [Streptomyces lanatus]